MNCAYRMITSAALFSVLTVTPLHGGGLRCPPRQGMIETSGAGIVFVDDASRKSYFLDKPEMARRHLGHKVTIVGHPMRLRPTTIAVHEIHCAEHG